MTDSAPNAVDTYIRACFERDPVLRAELLQASFAETGRMVTGGRELRGRDEVLAMLNRFWASPDLVGIRLTSAVDQRGAIFRYSAVAEFRDGTRAEAFDAGELNADGQIALILTFAGPLPTTA